MEQTDDLAGAQGKLVLFIASLFQRAGIATTGVFGELLKVYAASVAETDPGQGEILLEWAAAISGVSAG